MYSENNPRGRELFRAISITFLIFRTLLAQNTHSVSESPITIQNILKRYDLAELEKAFHARSDKTIYDSTPKDLQSVPSPALSQEIIYRQKTIYGFDRRKELFEVTDAKQLAVAGAVGGLVSSQSFIDTPTGIRIKGDTLEISQHLCTSVVFKEQIVGPNCTAFIIGSDLIATAGHCTGGWRNSRFVLGYVADKSNQARLEIPSAQVYSLTSLLERAEEADGVDYAVFKVDREIKNHEPLKLNLAGHVSQDDEVYVIGHPSGLPLKLADHAFVRRNPTKGYFVANLDTFGGNSGSPVFNSVTHEVEGILVRGDTDYEREGTCRVAFVCPGGSDCRGEDSTLISVLSKVLKQAGKSDLQIALFTKTFTSGPKISGSGRNFSGNYELVSDIPPDGYLVGSFRYSLSGDRSCGNWASCSGEIQSGRVVFRFSLQGHDEWRSPGQALSEGNLVVTYVPK